MLKISYRTGEEQSLVYAVYIAAAAVIGLLIGFVALSVLWLKKTVLKNIRSRTLELISVYDELLEEKSKSLKELEKKAAKAASKSGEQTDSNGLSAGQELKNARDAKRSALSPSGMTKQVSADSYRDPRLGGLYRKIRESFSFNPDEIIQILTESKLTERENPAGKLLKELNPDTVYRLSSLEPETQIGILRESLGQEEAELLDNYMQKHKKFAALEFYDYLLFQADAENENAVLSVPKSALSHSLKLGRVTVLPDEEICEGFQLEEDNILYDYCIKARELG